MISYSAALLLRHNPKSLIILMRFRLRYFQGIVSMHIFSANIFKRNKFCIQQPPFIDLKLTVYVLPCHQLGFRPWSRVFFNLAYLQTAPLKSSGLFVTIFNQDQAVDCSCCSFDFIVTVGCLLKEPLCFGHVIDSRLINVNLC